MAQKLNNKDLQSCYYGQTEIDSIYYGDNLVWRGIKYVDLGSARTFNIKNYTDNWANLTANNFFMVGNSGTASLSGNDSDDSYIVYLYDGYRKVYDASTGSLTFEVYLYNAHSNTYAYGNVHAVLIENTAKLVSLGTGKSFNVRSYSNYGDFTYKNFLTLKPDFASGTNREIGGVRNPRVWSASARARQSYSNGVFTCDFYGEYNHQNTGSGTPRTRSESMVVYLYPKKILT